MEHLSVSHALSCVLESVKKLDVETVKIEKSLGRVLAQDVYANRNQPPYDVSAMDGYALRSADISSLPATLTIVEDIKAGDMPQHTLQAGQCARIMTGAPVPAGADAVLRVEDSEAVADTPRPNPLPQVGEEANEKINFSCPRVKILRSVAAGCDIRRLGENMRDGEVVLSAGTEITPGVVGILATVKASHLQVIRRPRVAILSTGNELEDMDDPVDANKIPNSNSYALMAQVQALGIEPSLLGIARDDPEELLEYLQRGLHFDVLLVSGGSSVGVHDYVRPSMESLGVKMLFWRVAMKPGHPLAFGIKAKVVEKNATQHGDTLVFGLPGNPVSSMVCFEEFVAPALRQMMGHTRLYRRTVTAKLSHAIKIRPGRTEFIRVMLSRDAHGYVATSTGTQSSGVSLSMARADGLLVASSTSNGLAAGESVTVQLLDGTAFQNEIGFKE